MVKELAMPKELAMLKELAMSKEFAMLKELTMLKECAMLDRRRCLVIGAGIEFVGKIRFFSFQPLHLESAVVQILVGKRFFRALVAEVAILERG